MKKKEKVYLITYNKEISRAGEPCEVIGLRYVTQIDYSSIKNTQIISSICYKVIFEDGEVEYIDKKLADAEYNFVTLSDMLKYGTP